MLGMHYTSYQCSMIHHCSTEPVATGYTPRPRGIRLSTTMQKAWIPWRFPIEYLSVSWQPHSTSRCMTLDRCSYSHWLSYQLMSAAVILAQVRCISRHFIYQRWSLPGVWRLTEGSSIDVPSAGFSIKAAQLQADDLLDHPSAWN